MLSRACLALALVLGAAGILSSARRKSPVPAVPSPRLGGAQTWRRFELAEDGLELEHPDQWEPLRGFGKFTTRRLPGGIAAEDLVVFRGGAPRVVVSVVRYRVEARGAEPENWTRLAARSAPNGLLPEFGGSNYQWSAAGPERWCSAVGAVQVPLRGNIPPELWWFRSRFIPGVHTSLRVTCGTEERCRGELKSTFERVLRSVVWRE